MAIAETARLIASLELKDAFSKTVDNATRSLGKLDKGITNTQGRAYKAGQQIGTGIKRGALIAASAIALLSTQVLAGLHSLSLLEKASAQTNAVLKSTKSVAGQTAASIRNLAEKYEALNATVDDKVIQSAENVLLTFTAVRKQAFEPAIAAALDMSTALGTNLQGAVVQIGKALQDPVKGITALRKAGVNFTKDQQDQIKALVKSNRLYDAQRIVLKELNKEFGGSFAAGGNTVEGVIAGIGDAVEDLQIALARGLFPILQKVLPRIRAALADPQVLAQVDKLGKSIASLFTDENIEAGANVLKGVFQTAKTAAPILQATAEATLTIVKAAVGLFTSLPKELQTLAVGAFAVNKLTGGLVTNIAGGLFDFLKGTRGASPANPLFVSDVTGGLGKGVPGVPGATGGGLTGLLKIGLASLVAAGIVEAAVPIGKAFANALPAELKGPGGKGESEAQRRIREGKEAMAAKGTIVPTLLDRGGREKGSDQGVTQGGFSKQYAKAFNSYAARSLRKADALLSDGKLSRADLRKLQDISRNLKDHKLPQAAQQIRQKIDDARKAQVAATNASKNAIVKKEAATAAAIRAKDLSINAVFNAFTTVSVRDQIKRTNQSSRYAIQVRD